MALEFKVPELGENVEKGDVVRVMVKVGDVLKIDQSLVRGVVASSEDAAIAGALIAI